MKLANYLLPVTLIPMVSCTTVKKVPGPDGSLNQLISCPAVEGCYEKAAEVCNGKYSIVNTSTETRDSGTITNLLVKCENPQ